MERVAARIDDGRQLAVGDACAHRHRARFFIERDLVELHERNLILRAVGDAY